MIARIVGLGPIFSSHEGEGRSQNGLYIKSGVKMDDIYDDYLHLLCRRCYKYVCRLVPYERNSDKPLNSGGNDEGEISSL